MNTSATLALLGLALAGTAPAAPIIVKITGSTAFRSAIHASIASLMPDGGTVPETVAFSPTSSNLAGATQANFHGTIDGVEVLIKCSWNGSVEGVEGLTNPTELAINFLGDAVYGTANSAAGGTGVAAGTTVGVPDIGLSDVFQTSTRFTSPELIDNQVGVIPFQFVAGNGAPANLTNISPSVAQLLYGAGKLPLALFTGDAGDHTKAVYAMGRNNVSGTRLTALAEIGLGSLSTVSQWSYGDTDGVGPLGNTYSSVNDGGYTSGGNTGVAGALKLPTTATSGFNIAYLGVADAANAIGGGAKALNWNGVAYSATAVREGSYTFWGYEHLFHKDDLETTAPEAFAVAQALIGAIPANLGSAGLTIDSMQVSRTSDGAVVGSNYSTPTGSETPVTP